MPQNSYILDGPIFAAWIELAHFQSSSTSRPSPFTPFLSYNASYPIHLAPSLFLNSFEPVSVTLASHPMPLTYPVPRRHMRLQVGLLNADVVGPSLPNLLALDIAGCPLLAGPRDYRPPLAGLARTHAPMLPLQALGVLCMSMGFLVPARVAAV
ncbi:unnamed protein product [Closterium sp. NIES-65]|nr:unnamed protein product [Closterium sp. NIES-65]CAI5996791.1 unnamed protein product [Closterium sp. NIES-65]CAI5996799.1 unnamed protein product [Closterium sp. NIES-65]